MAFYDSSDFFFQKNEDDDIVQSTEDDDWMSVEPPSRYKRVMNTVKRVGEGIFGKAGNANPVATLPPPPLMETQITASTSSLVYYRVLFFV